MKSQLIAIIAAVLVVGCGESQPPEPPDISIYDAAGDGNIEAVKQHIAAGTDLDAKMQGGHTPLQDAATKAVAELLIAKGADVNAKNENGGTPLLYATLSGHREIDERLEEYALVQLDVLRSFLSNMKNWSETVVNRIYPGSRISVKMIDPPGRRPYC